ncbi:inositol-3-phosphate synthase [Streptantibioticus parmotrematis]|uniref:inositol-3-phosphate synthase n=1 Tax=Streptantibioticus parmotrematis TaxID=2873249 RepID=UPI003404A840
MTERTGRITVGVVGVGNCVASLVQGVEFYADAPDDAPGLTHPVCAGYAVADVAFTAAFDVDAGKIGKDLSEAVWAEPNNASRFADVPHLGVPVDDGVLADGVGAGTAPHIETSGHASVEDVARRLTETGTRVLVNFLPTGSQSATEAYAQAALRAGCAFVNCMPARVAREPRWARAFADAGLPLIGDDLKSQFGSTLVHHALLDALAANGVRLRDTYQLNNGGNMDFLNLRDPERMRGKKETKARGMGAGAGAPRVHVGAEYVPFLADRKVAYIRVEAEAFGGTPVEIDLRMCVEDSPSAAGNVLDAVRYAQAALDAGHGGVLAEASAALMKAPTD